MNPSRQGGLRPKKEIPAQRQLRGVSAEGLILLEADG